MARAIVTLPDPVLRAPCAPVDRFDEGLARLADEMLEAMYAAPGRGLAAPQLGVALRLFVMDPGWKDGAPEPRVLVNPELLEASEETSLREEACLSIPGRSSWVRRPARVRLRWRDLEGRPREGSFDGFAATCAQHEMDHLDGVLCIDREEPGPA
jgi:peptide deformylase